jgi:ankyrin repeat protein
MSTFNELRKHHTDFFTLKDVRHWSLLHVAMNAKRIEMMRLLVHLGADPHARSLPKQFLVPEELKGLAVTPGDIARLRGPDVFSAYTEALRAAGHQVDVVKDEADGDEDLFWPATEAREVI